MGSSFILSLSNNLREERSLFCLQVAQFVVEESQDRNSVRSLKAGLTFHRAFALTKEADQIL